jgi:hypothetical protein
VEARKEGHTVAALIEKLLLERERAERFRAIREFQLTRTPEQLADLHAEYAELESMNLDFPEW